jgi:hypothetical protein
MRILGRNKKNEDQFGRRRPDGKSMPTAGPNRTFSYYASRSTNDLNVGRSATALDARIQDGKHGRMRAILRNTPIVIASVVIVACVLDQLVLSSSPKIVTISSTSGSVFLRGNAEYQTAAAALFKDSLANRNKLTVDVNGIRAAMRREFPELSDVSVTLPIIGHRPVVYIQPSEPALALTTVNGDTYLLNSSGEALIHVQSQAILSNLHVATVTDQSGLQVSVGRTVIPSTTVQFIQTVMSQLAAQHLQVGKVVLPSSGSELDVYPDGGQYFGKFNLQQADALQQVGTFIAVVKQLSSQGKTPGQYVDVRLDGRAYYK